MTAPVAGATLAEELRRRRMALGWTLEQVAERAQVSVGMLSLIETGKRRPSLRTWERIRQALGIIERLPEEAWHSSRARSRTSWWLPSGPVWQPCARPCSPSSQRRPVPLSRR